MVFNSQKAGDKYKKDMIEAASKDPKSVKVKTPMGWMTMLEAAEMGFDPKTGKFKKGKGLAKVNPDESLKDVPPEQRDKLKGMMDPKNTDMPPEAMEKLGNKGGMFNDFMPKGGGQVPGGPPPTSPPPGVPMPGGEGEGDFPPPKPGSDVLGGIM